MIHASLIQTEIDQDIEMNCILTDISVCNCPVGST